MRRSLASFGVAALLASTFSVVGVIGAGVAGAAPTAIATVFTFGEAEGDVSCEIVSVDLGTGTTTTLLSRDDERCPIDYAPRTDGQIFGVTLTGDTSDDPSRLVTVDPTTGAMTDVGSTGVQFSDIGAVEFDAAGALWASGTTDDPGCDDIGVCTYQLDPTTGTATLVGDIPGGDAIIFEGGLTRTCVDPLYTNVGRLVIPSAAATPSTDATVAAEAEAAEGDDFDFMRNSSDVGVSQIGEGILSILDTSTPAFEEIGPLGDTEFATGLAYASDGVLWSVVLDELFVMSRTYSTGTIDPATGEFTKVATLDVTETPEEAVFPSGLTFLPDPCAPAVVPVALEPTFTG